MSLAPGVRLGVYEVVALLGAGGMGEVYRARDTKLKRDVAIKVLPDTLAHDQERLARFQREAEVLATLNHTHIASIYGLEESSDTRAIVMEFVEGETLSDRIGAALPVSEALGIARQIAEALQAAHDKGIVHRDLKPANIALTADGHVKVLDFGLAKLVETEAGARPVVSSVSQVATITTPAMMTGAGVILGTAVYMSPEQAKGREADKRSDVWAFGCVLYEMLAGKRAFEGEDVSDTLAAILRGEPDWTALPLDVPVPVQTLLRACLEKDRRRRTADIGAALFVLDHLGALVASSSVPKEPDPAYVLREVAVSEAAAAVSAARREQARLERRRVAMFSAATLVLGAVLAGIGIRFFTVPGPAPVVRLLATPPAAIPLAVSGVERTIAISRDGSQVAYVAGSEQSRLYLRRLDSARVIEGFNVPREPFFSPDGQWLAAFDGGELKKVLLTGGPPIVICRITNVPRGATWSSDGTIIFSVGTVSASGLFRVSENGGEPQKLTTPDGNERIHAWPEMLAETRWVLFTITPRSRPDDSLIAARNLQTGEQKVLFQGGSHAQYARGGYLVYAASGTLRAVAFNLTRLEVTGAAVPVVPKVMTTATGAANYAVSEQGTLAYVPGSLQAPSRPIVWIDRTGREEPTAAPLRDYLSVRVSPDGRRAAVYINDVTQAGDIWIWSFETQTLTRLTFPPGNNRQPVWTPDGRRVVFASNRDGAPNLFWQAADGSGSVERLTTGGNDQIPSSFSPDGKRLLFNELRAKTKTDIFMLSLDGDRQSTPVLQTPSDERNGTISPDGRWMAYESNESGRFEIYVRPFPDVAGGRWQVSTTGGAQPIWARGNQELFYVSPADGMTSVSIQHETSWASSAPRKLFVDRMLQSIVLNRSPYDVSPDGRRFLVARDARPDEKSSDASDLVIVQNWQEELKRLVPSR